LRYGPLVYNIEKVDQDILQPLSSESALTPEWKEDLLDGVIALKGSFADGTPLLAIPNYARNNRDPAVSEAPPPPAAPGASGRRVPRPPTSIVWIKKQ